MVTKIKSGAITETDLKLIVLLGLPDAIIGHKLHILPGAVSMRISRVAVKLGVENRTALIIKALKLGLVTTSQLSYRDYGVHGYGKANTS